MLASGRTVVQEHPVPQPPDFPVTRESATASKWGAACIVVSKGGNWPAGTQGDAPMEYLFETLIPVVFYAAVLLFLFGNLSEA